MSWKDKITNFSGEGASAKDALEALAFSLDDEWVDKAGTVMIRVRPTKLRPLGRDTSDLVDGYIAEVVK